MWGLGLWDGYKSCYRETFHQSILQYPSGSTIIGAINARAQSYAVWYGPIYDLADFLFIS